jgi:HlyD family secretion protein
MTMKNRLFAVVLAALGGVGLVISMQAREREPSAAAQPDSGWVTQAVETGDVRRVISATGTLQPVSVVQVGTQVSGAIARLHVDFNDSVRSGALLAELDPRALDADLEVAKAQRASAQVTLDLALIQAARHQRLFEQGFVSRQDVDQSASSVRGAEAGLRAQDAALRRAAHNRRNAEIRSPVSGIVISRDVSIGQTVAASLQTPILFRIAQDLRAMQIEASVSEADVGLIREGQSVQFAVDAFPDKAFSGRVRQIRNNHQVVQNVVTYTAIVTADNPDLVLRPGMTAYVTVTVADKQNVLRLPNAALRYRPTQRPPERVSIDAPGRRTVWRVDAGGTVVPVEVGIGLSDTRWTEVIGSGLTPGDRLVVGERRDKATVAPRIF